MIHLINYCSSNKYKNLKVSTTKSQQIYTNYGCHGKKIYHFQLNNSRIRDPCNMSLSVLVCLEIFIR